VSLPVRGGVAAQGRVKRHHCGAAAATGGRVIASSSSRSQPFASTKAIFTICRKLPIPDKSTVCPLGVGSQFSNWEKHRSSSAVVDRDMCESLAFKKVQNRQQGRRIPNAAKNIMA
jgi:hypothetical protein